ncbi:tRNA (adenosine(37)-N6)-threonylcarbamoyltransferase complex ATPase subunit type 1 TsaE [Campylobacter sp. 19-13652]|uniref:tRNA (adenosine(37)-N6)-threonylcarbamoyltransferase complex ATPase subunit type 1 TsaE n=1 Tax=Campylobacter sp. 19-13652 TaxID=2840180 RepID=UPI001C782426|nr:tRNA (adenosine(37)-N6)-threonylcarbamoyltransferase complex ATPase subunit type 1 TsaE [Campylobacter sp. 19-13652]BCX79826.1 tRNA (adenosine(37)-N6)-threonylcarbamoyltransferase complex ATPase subunit type 1 TsaE [Campylobacter sp. 19-13652]
MKKLSASKEELSKVVNALPKEGVIILKGDLASGKTTLTKALALTLGIDEEITSPTFSIMQSYEFATGMLYHYDIYQNGFSAMVQNGLFENLLQDGLHVIEWGDDELIKALKKYAITPTVVKISVKNSEREYEIYEA